MIFNEKCEIFSLRVVRKNHEDIPEKILVKSGIPCKITLSSEFRDINASKLEQIGNFVISMRINEVVSVGDEIHTEDGRKLSVESVKKRVFSLGNGSLKILAKLI